MYTSSAWPPGRWLVSEKEEEAGVGEQMGTSSPFLLPFWIQTQEMETHCGWWGGGGWQANVY